MLLSKRLVVKFLLLHLELVELLLGDDVWDVTGVRGGGHLFGPLQPILQVRAISHKLIPLKPTLL